MRNTQQLSVTLPLEMVNYIKNKVISGEYASESEVIQEGVYILMARDRAIERWLKEAVAPAYDRLKADPSRSMTAEQIRAGLRKKTDIG